MQISTLGTMPSMLTCSNGRASLSARARGNSSCRDAIPAPPRNSWTIIVVAAAAVRCAGTRKRCTPNTRRPHGLSIAGPFANNNNSTGRNSIIHCYCCRHRSVGNHRTVRRKPCFACPTPSPSPFAALFTRNRMPFAGKISCHRWSNASVVFQTCMPATMSPQRRNSCLGGTSTLSIWDRLLELSARYYSTQTRAVVLLQDSVSNTSLPNIITSIFYVRPLQKEIHAHV